MFGRAIFIATLGVAAALLGSFSLLERLPAPASVAAAPAPAAVSADAPSPEPPARETSGYRETLLAGRRSVGNMRPTRSSTGSPVRMLIDTGASAVFVSASTAARLGLVPSSGRKVAIQTANGRSTASPVVLQPPEPSAAST